MWLRLLGLSAGGAVLLNICYDLLIFKWFHFKQTIIWPLMIGIITAVPSSVCMIFLYEMNTHNITGGFIFCGMFLIFPLWYYGMAA